MVRASPWLIGAGYSIPAHSPEEAEAIAKAGVARTLNNPVFNAATRSEAGRLLRLGFRMQKQCDPHGQATYTVTAERAFQNQIELALKDSGYVPRFEIAVGKPDSSSDKENDQIFRELLKRFDSGPDYLATVGTQVSIFAKEHYLGRIPLIFIAVTDPIAVGLVKGFDPDRARGNIGGVAYGDVPSGVRFLQQSFPGAHIGFYYNSQIPQDKIVANGLGSCCPEIGLFDEIQNPLGTSPMDDIDLLFGWYYFNRNFIEIKNKFHGAMVAGNEADMTRGAVAMLANNDEEAGSLGATQVLLPTLLQGTSLSDERIMRVKSRKFAINRKVARRHGLSVANHLPAGTVEYE